MHFRLATAADIAAIATLENEQYAAEGYPAAFLFQAYRQWPHLLWIAERQPTIAANGTENPDICAYLLAAPGKKPQQFWIMSLLVAQHARGMQLGRSLLKHVIDEFQQHNAKQLWLSVAPENTAAVQLYSKLGFEKKSYHSDYLGKGEHRDILCLNFFAE